MARSPEDLMAALGNAQRDRMRVRMIEDQRAPTMTLGPGPIVTPTEIDLAGGCHPVVQDVSGLAPGEAGRVIETDEGWSPTPDPMPASHDGD